MKLQGMLTKFTFNISLAVPLLIFAIVSGCRDNANPADGGGYSIGPPVPFIVYDSPIWHPGGQLIGFNHTPIKGLHYVSGNQYPDQYELERDSTGFWLINSDGTNMRRIFPYILMNPAWSPDGQWVAFVAGTEIFKMRFTGTTFDTTTLTQLTSVGRNFLPSWSPNGQQIAEDRSYAWPESSSVQGIWIFQSSDGSNRVKISTGGMPSWHPDGQRLIFTDWFTSSIGGIVEYDLRTASRTLLLDGRGADIRTPKFSPSATAIAFSMQPMYGQINLWMVDSTGNNLRQTTTEGIADYSFSWSPSGDFVVFAQYRSDRWPPQNGTLWILDVATAQKRQLTFNPPPTN